MCEYECVIGQYCTNIKETLNAINSKKKNCLKNYIN